MVKPPPSQPSFNPHTDPLTPQRLQQSNRLRRLLQTRPRPPPTRPQPDLPHQPRPNLLLPPHRLPPHPPRHLPRRSRHRILLGRSPVRRPPQRVRARTAQKGPRRLLLLPPRLRPPRRHRVRCRVLGVAELGREIRTDSAGGVGRGV